MKYSYGARIDCDSNAVTIIDETERTANTTGYINGEYVEFSGGDGGSSDFSTATVTVNYNFTQLPEDGDPAITIEGVSVHDEDFMELTGVFKNNDKWERQDYHIISTNSNSYDVEVLFLYANNKHVTLYPAFDATIAVSGNATVLPDTPMVDITGDCTITIE